MRRTYPVRMGDLWTDFLKDCPNIARKINEAKIPDIWAEIVGSYIAGMTTSINISRGVLHVTIASSVVRNEVFMRRGYLVAEINRRLGGDTIRNVIVK